jgi:hypothetical protein
VAPNTNEEKISSIVKKLNNIVERVNWFSMYFNCTHCNLYSLLFFPDITVKLTQEVIIYG